MKRRIYCLLLLTGFLGFLSCASDDDSPDPPSGGTRSDINRFVWRAMNEYYYWQDEVPKLSDDFFNTDTYNNLINQSEPEKLFNQLLFSKDGKNGNHYSIIKSDYEELENLFNGVSSSTGFKLGLIRVQSEMDILRQNNGFLVLYVTDKKIRKLGLKRGDIITKINNTLIKKDNLKSLLSQPTLNLERFIIKKVGDKNKLIPTKNITIHTSQGQKNPIVFDTIFKDGRKKIGYLVYTDFLREYNDELNEVFRKFKSEGVNELILDLRYNGGGNVETSTYLASMITGQFNDKVYAELRWNQKNHRIDDYKFGDEMNIYELRSNHSIGTENINHLKLNRLVVIGTKYTASASELIINGLKGVDFPVILIGQKTEGKNVASITLYDSPDFTKEHINPDHRYAMQLIVSKSYNEKGKSDYSDGFSPKPKFSAKDLSDLANIHQFGDTEEPMLKTALNYIDPDSYKTNRSGRVLIKDKIPFKMLLFSKDLNPFNKDMTIK